MIDRADITVVYGLSEEEASSRLKEEGLNEITPTRKRTIYQAALDILKEPMLLLLVIAGTIYFLLGDLGEALILMSFVFLVIGIAFFQDRRTERALVALRELASPRALVIRDGAQKRIAGLEVVRGDVLILNEGDRVPADAVLLECANLAVDESLLTGESMPARKIACDGGLDMERPGGDDRPYVYAGTLVVKGHGIAVVRATGVDTEMGIIGKSLEEIKPEPTLLQKETRTVVRNVAVLSGAFCALVVITYGITRSDWLEGVLVGITMAMAVLPEEFPLVLTVFLTLGAWRLSKNRVLTRNMPAIETLGAATVLCVDKTGTLTLNRMTVEKLVTDDVHYDAGLSSPDFLPEPLHELVEFSILASQKDPFDPVETAITEMGERSLRYTEHLHEDWILEREYPLSPQLMALSHVWRSPDGQDYVIATKGAPEAIADLCHFDVTAKKDLSRRIEELASEGLRLIAIAKASFTVGALPVDQHDFTFEFLGLVGLRDPVRPAVRDSVRECYEAGIKVIMITGDYAGTARYVAGQIGLVPEDKVITGDELDRLDDLQLRERIRDIGIFARVVPDQKLRIVKALKENGEVVAMTGDGVNDAPALKAAHIGVAMGARGTDVAREAASLVLLDDDFSSIEKAVKMGRTIYDNLKKAMSYIIAIHMPIAGMSLIPVIFKLPLVFAPVHIAFLEVIIDPACSLVFEAEREGEVMKRPPRKPHERIFNKTNVWLSIFQGLSVLAIVAFVYSFFMSRDMGSDEVRAVTFTTLVIANLGLILTNLSWEETIGRTLRNKNVALWLLLLGTAVMLGIALYVPFMRRLFRFEMISALDLAVCVGAGFLSVVWFEIFKVLTRKRQRSAAESN